MGTAAFRGGVHPEYFKELTASLAILPMPPPKKVIIPMKQHAGAPSEPLVKPGDKVLLGQKIGDTEKSIVTSPVHATVSGEVTAVDPYVHCSGLETEAVTIESDGEDTWAQPLPGKADWEQLSAEELLGLIPSKP